MKIFIIIGTRPEIVRLAQVIKRCKKYFDTKLVHTGQNYDYQLNDVFFQDLDLAAPDFYLGISGNAGEIVGKVIEATYNLFVEHSPDCVIVLGDTNSCLSAYSAKRLKIPIVHLEAGNRAFDPNVPEEINRRIIDHISDINVCYMEHARRNLLLENIKPQYLFVCGSPIPEVHFFLKNKITQSTVLERLDLDKDDYFVWSVHREDNVDVERNFKNMVECIKNIVHKYKKKVIFGAHPRTQNKIKEYNVSFPPEVHITEPFGIIDYCQLMKNSLCTISDSGTLTEESNLLPCRGILYRYSTEHPEGVDNGNIILSNISWKDLETSLKIALEEPIQTNLCEAYQNIDFSQKVLKIICSYPSIVNKFNWLKDL